MQWRSMAYVGKNTIYVCQNACHSSQNSLSLFNKTAVIYNILQLSLSLSLLTEVYNILDANAYL